MDKTQISSHGLALLRSMPALERLSVNATAIDDEGLQHVSQMPALKKLYIVDTKATAKGIMTLAKCPQLTFLLVGKGMLTEDEACRFMRMHPGLEVLIANNHAQ